MRSTPYMINEVISAANEKQKTEIKRALFTAYHFALFERQTRLPSIERVLRDGEEMEEAELEGKIMAWAHSHNARYQAGKMLGIAEE